MFKGPFAKNTGTGTRKGKWSSGNSQFENIAFLHRKSFLSVWSREKVELSSKVQSYDNQSTFFSSQSNGKCLRYFSISISIIYLFAFLHFPVPGAKNDKWKSTFNTWSCRSA